MLTIECTGRQARVFYLIVLAVSLFFILVNYPLFPRISSSLTTTSDYFPITRFIEHQLDLKVEGVLATWYSSIVLFMAGLWALLNSRIGPASGWLMWLSRAGWLLIAFVLVGLSADEVAQVHESLAPLLNSTSEGASRRVGAGDWIPILLPLIIFVSIFMLAFFIAVVRKSKVSMALGLVGILCWAGAIFAEAVEAGFWESDTTYVMRGFIEESLELLGTTCLLISFLEFKLSQRKGARSPLVNPIELDDSSEPADAIPSPPPPADVTGDPDAVTGRDPVSSQGKL